MKFSPALLDEIRARLPVSQVVSRKVKLKRQGREFAGLSPFKVEKTPSFTVNDQKGFYHCFASGEHGDIFTFVMKTEGLSFPEAVERLAGEAGVSMPKASPREAAEHDRRGRLLELVEASAKYFEQQLYGQAGREALRYVEKRGLTRETLVKFRIGYAPAGRAVLKEHLAKAGFTTDDMVLSGMLIGGADIPVPYDRFRDRLMFPITDAKDRVVAFGGRALEKDAKPKYLNSPETPLFHKGHLLFNAAKARSAAHDHGQIIVVEGYMDAIALSQAGFPESVAPLGTALTPEQIGNLWRMTPEPILCFDGDDAGRRAAYRAVDTALPLLKPGLSLRFAFLPDGLDPDDLIRLEGPDRMQLVLSRARALSDVLWERQWSAGDWSTPERRARLVKEIDELVGRIDDGGVRGFYAQAMREKLADAFGSPAPRGPSATPGKWPATPGNSGGSPYGRTANRAGGGRSAFTRNGANAPAFATSSLRNSRLAVGQSTDAASAREALILKAVVNHPWLIDDYAEALAALSLQGRTWKLLRDAVLQVHALHSALDMNEMRHQLRSLGQDHALAQLDRAHSHRSDRFAEPDATPDKVDEGFLHTLRLHERLSELERKIKAAQQALDMEQSDEAFAQLRELKRRLDEVSGHDAPLEG